MAAILPQNYWIIFAVITGIISGIMLLIYFGVLTDYLMGEHTRLPGVFNIIFICVAFAAITCTVCAARAPEKIQHNSFTISDANACIPPDVAEKIFAKAFDSLPVDVKYRIISGQRE